MRIEHDAVRYFEPAQNMSITHASSTDFQVGFEHVGDLAWAHRAGHEGVA